MACMFCSILVCKPFIMLWIVLIYCVYAITIFFIKTLGIWLKQYQTGIYDLLKHGPIIVRTRALFIKFCIARLNLPTPPSIWLGCTILTIYAITCPYILIFLYLSLFFCISVILLSGSLPLPFFSLSFSLLYPDSSQI